MEKKVEKEELRKEGLEDIEIKEEHKIMIYIDSCIIFIQLFNVISTN